MLCSMSGHNYQQHADMLPKLRRQHLAYLTMPHGIPEIDDGLWPNVGVACKAAPVDGFTAS